MARRTDTLTILDTVALEIVDPVQLTAYAHADVAVTQLAQESITLKHCAPQHLSGLGV